VADFKFEGLTIERLIAHTIFARGKDKEAIPPHTSDSLIQLPPETLGLIQIRITDALGSKSHGIETEIGKSDSGSFMQTAASMIHMDEGEFIKHSQKFAEELTEAQTNPRWPGGILIILSGKVGGQQWPFLAVIKAETDKGLNVEEAANGQVSLTLVKRMLLSETQRLYKIGVLIEMSFHAATADGFSPGNYRSFLFDHLLTATETRNAAAYFYDSFLGMKITGSSKHQTRIFYEESKSFINGMQVEAHEKYELLEALRSELRSNNGTISISSFASEHLPEDYANEYQTALVSAGLPNQAIVKDPEYIKAKLRRPRKLKFTSGVQIQAPPGVDVSEHVEVSPSEDGYTNVKIKGVIEEQE